jgi:Gas vesicle synthesis protein GvpL/GvpF
MTTGRETATYVFCLVQSAREPSLRGVPDSVPGAGVPRLIPIDDEIWAVVADAPLARFGGEGLRNDLQDVESISRHALAHAAVVEFFFRRSPVIPLKLFTLFSADARVQQHLMSRRARLRTLFAQLRGHEEWGVRVITRDVGAAPAQTATSGRDYLQIKKRLSKQGEAPSRVSVKEANAALKVLGKRASKIRKDSFPRAGQGRPYVASASFLVKAQRRNLWRREVARLSAALAKQGHRLEVTGPWPPYHFVTR